jgi:Fe-S cluster assembly protein SufD
MNSIDIKDRFLQLQSLEKDSSLEHTRKEGFAAFSKMGIPNSRNEEWKYTRISGLFDRDFQWDSGSGELTLEPDLMRTAWMPGHGESNALVFFNGHFSPALSVVRSRHLQVLPLEEAAKGELSTLVAAQLGQSTKYLKDGILALSTAFLQGGLFLYVKKGYRVEHPVYIYHIVDAREYQRFSQPRILAYVEHGGSLQVAETFYTFGGLETLTNHVTELVVGRDAYAEYYKIQNDKSTTNLISTSHIRQTGKSYTHSAVITLNGGIVRNNLNNILESEHCETHLYGLYCLEGSTHVDNHTVVDNVRPNCLSNELYKGIMDGQSTAVFNGKIFVRKDAQKTNAYQSNKNILISEQASVNSKPQLEIFADDVKCSHGCTVGSLDAEALFYLRSRGLSGASARGMLLRAFALDILENIKLPAIRTYVDQLIYGRLAIDES